MSREVAIIVSVVMTICLATASYATDFVPASGSWGYWNDDANWTDGVPGSGDTARCVIGSGGVTAVVHTADAVAQHIQWDNSSGAPYDDPLVIEVVDGGALTARRISVTYGSSGPGAALLLVNGGSVTNLSNDNLEIGFERTGGQGTLQLNSGNVFVQKNMSVAYGTSCTGIVNVAGGVLQVENNLVVGDKVGGGSQDNMVGYFNLTGNGQLLATGNGGGYFRAGNLSGSACHISVDDNALLECGTKLSLGESGGTTISLSLQGNGVVDANNFTINDNATVSVSFTESGLLKIGGDATGNVAGWASSGVMSGSGGTYFGMTPDGTDNGVNWAYDSGAGETVVWAIPEPASLFAIGLFGMLYFGHKFRRRQ